MKKIITDIEKLSERADEIDVRKEGELARSIVLDLKDILRSKKDIVALSAPQIGISKRIFVIKFNNELKSFINPIISGTKGLELSREKCSSIPKKQYILPRHNEIEVVYQTPLGKVESRKLIGLAAKVFQHQMNHLDGLLISDIGFEVDKDFDKATEEERQEVIQAYLESLDIRQKEVEKEISENEDLKKMSDAVEFIGKLQKGEIEIQPIEKKSNEPKEE